MRRQIFAPATALLAYGVFSALWMTREIGGGAPPPEVFDRVVAPASVQLLLAGGDRFLAANLESIRAVATAREGAGASEYNAVFAIRARRAVSLLNPCHEDNYYHGNALLTWGGAVAEGNELLRRATGCRIWDEFPPFFYGFNQYFFLQDVQGAREALEVAAERATKNAAGFRKFAIMIAADEIKDDNLALDYLESERDHASDPKLRDMLDKRVQRLKGLIVLREAQVTFESRTGRALPGPAALIDSGILEFLPQDPLRVGYEFVDGRFRLREIKVQGVERPQ